MPDAMAPSNGNSWLRHCSSQPRYVGVLLAPFPLCQQALDNGLFLAVCYTVVVVLFQPHPSLRFARHVSCPLIPQCTEILWSVTLARALSSDRVVVS